MERKLFCVIIVILCCLCSCNSLDSQPYAQKVFNKNKDAFNSLNQYFIDYYLTTTPNKDELFLTFENSDETGKIDKIYSGDINDYICLSEDRIALLGKIEEAFTYDFSYVSITDTMVTYGGEGYEKFIYSSDGRRPKSFWRDGTKSSFRTYYLGENWYYLFLKVR